MEAEVNVEEKLRLLAVDVLTSRHRKLPFLMSCDIIGDVWCSTAPPDPGRR